MPSALATGGRRLRLQVSLIQHHQACRTTMPLSDSQTALGK